MRRTEGLVVLVRVKCNNMSQDLTGLPPVTITIIARIILIIMTQFSLIILNRIELEQFRFYFSK